MTTDTISGWQLMACACISLALSGSLRAAEQETQTSKTVRPTAKSVAEPKTGDNAASKAAVAPRSQARVGKVAESGTPQRATPPAGRFQMLKAGERVVILDTQTGETRIIEPEAPRALQQVEVGRAWVVVTVLGNASSSERQTGPRGK